MWLIVGLGNPGVQYETSRHNVGFMVLDNLVEEYNEKFKNSASFFAKACKLTIAKEKSVLIKPTTFMNESGRSVRAAMDWYGLDETSLIVVYDDMDLDIGRIRIREKGSAGGHNGMKSIISHIGNSDFTRIRIGIGKPEFERGNISHVLSSFCKEELTIISESTIKAVKAIETILEHGVMEAQSKYNAFD